MKIAIAAATAPISGRVSTRANSDFLTGAGASVVLGGCVAGVVAGELMICSRSVGTALPRGRERRAESEKQFPGGRGVGEVDRAALPRRPHGQRRLLAV